MLEPLPRHAEQLLTARRLERLDQVARHRLGAVTLFFEDIHDSQNFSACVRSAEAFGLPAVHIATQSPVTLLRNPSGNARRWLDIHWHDTAAEAIAALSAQGFTLAATVPSPLPGELPVASPPVPYQELELPPKLALFFGNEKRGLTEETLAACDVRLTIPTWGFTESLNLSNSTAILLAHLADAYRQRALPCITDEDARDLRDSWIAREVTHKLRGNQVPE